MKNEFTKKELLNAVIEMALNFEGTVEIGEKKIAGNDVVEFAEKTIAQLDAKAVKAKEKAAEKKTADPLRDAVAEALTDAPQTVDEITAKIEGEDVTKAKVVARLTALVKAGVAGKAETKIEGRKGKVMTYFVADNGGDAADAEAIDEDVE